MKQKSLKVPSVHFEEHILYASFSLKRYTGIPGLWTQELDTGLWTLDSVYWTLDTGLWTLDSGRWTLDAGFWTLDSGLWTLNAER